MDNVIATFTNAAEGLETYVAKTPRGFAVTLKDVDADEFLPQAEIFKTQDAAEAYAKICAGLE